MKINRALRRTAERTAWKTGFKCPLASCWMVRQRPGRMWAEGESEGLQTLGIVVVLCSSLKLLHYLGLIDLSDGKRTLELPCFIRMCFSAYVVMSLENARKVARRPESFAEALPNPSGTDTRLPQTAPVMRCPWCGNVVPGELENWRGLDLLFLPRVRVGLGGLLAV